MAQPTQERLAAQLEKPGQTPGNVGHAGSGTGPENAPHFEAHEDDHVHHVAMSTYYVVFALLMFLLFITVGAWYIDQHYFPLGKFSTPLAMAIAVAKAVAIVLIFMHVKFSSRLVQIFACTGVAFSSIMFLLTFNDYGTRDWLPRPGVYPQVQAADVGKAKVEDLVIIRSSAEGAASNMQSTPADDLSSAGVIGANINIVPSTGGRPGETTGGAANNSFGSEDQARGIEPKRPAATTTR